MHALSPSFDWDGAVLNSLNCSTAVFLLNARRPFVEMRLNRMQAGERCLRHQRERQSGQIGWTDSHEHDAIISFD